MDLTETIKKLIDATDDAETLKGLAEVQRCIEEERQKAEEEKNERVERYSNLLGEYKKAVMEAPLPPKGTPEEKGEESTPAFSESLGDAFQDWKAKQHKA